MMAEEKIVLSTGRAVSPPPIQVVDPEKARVASASSIHNADAQKILEHGGDADEALKAMIANSDLVLDEATNKRLLRKIDWHLMPIMCVVYGINYLDKTTISYASIMGLKADLKLRGDNYQWLGSMFYFGYLAWEWPTSRLLQRLPLAKYSAFNVVMWGTTLTLFATTKNFAGALTVRFFLGVFEAAVGENDIFGGDTLTVRTGHSWLRSLHVPVVHQIRAGRQDWYMVLLQWRRTGNRRTGGLRYCRWSASRNHPYIWLEGRVHHFWAVDRGSRGGVLLYHA